MHAATDAVSPWVARFARLARPGDALDLACGAGRHARHLAALGHPVTALDRDAAALALAAGDGIATVQCDLEHPADGGNWPFGDGRFAAVVVTNYLHRALFGRIVASLAPDGMLVYETFAEGNAQFGKPANPDFLLAPGELLEVARRHGLRVLAFEDGYTDHPKPAMVQRLCAVRPAFPAAEAWLGPFGPRK